MRYEGVSVRYRDNLDLCLQDVDLLIAPQEKLGVVGRTGAGKTTLAMILLRALDVTRGRITIDGIDIRDVSVRTLRQRVSIIAQDACLFAGSLRQNLDMTGAASDEQLFQALQSVGLAQQVPAASLHQESSAQQWSAGQRQLICLARAIVRRSRVVLMDEATASVDPTTDALMQQTMRQELSHCTIMTIAHRLQSVMNADRVLVMHAGRVVQLDSPQRLMQQPDSVFAALAADAGIVAASDGASLQDDECESPCN